MHVKKQFPLQLLLQLALTLHCDKQVSFRIGTTCETQMKANRDTHWVPSFLAQECPGLLKGKGYCPITGHHS